MTTYFMRQLKNIEHRGRDGSKIVTLNKENNNILIGFNRLSIIDNNEKSMQPFTDENENIFLLFNGEI
jgi:asparagine synthetase B (glutamine-hydrolysing)